MRIPQLSGLVMLALSIVVASPSAGQDSTPASAEPQAPDRVSEDARGEVRARGDGEESGPGDGEVSVADTPGEVIVVDGRAPHQPATAASRLVTGALIAAAPRLSGDDLLGLVPGLHLSQHGSEGKGKQFFLRGFDAVHGSDIALEVAGIPLNELSNVHSQGYLDLGFVIAETVCSLRADKGSFVLEQGRFATAGSVAMELCVPRSRRGYQLGYELGTSNRHRLLAVLAPAELVDTTFFAAEAMHDDGFGSRRRSRRATALAQLRAASWRGGRVDVVAAAYAADFDEPGVVPLADFERGTLGFYDSYIDGGGESRRLLSGVRAHHERGAHDLDLAAHAQWRRLELIEDFTGFLLYPDHGDRRLQAHRALGAGIDGRWQWRVAPRLSLVGGGELMVEWLRQHEQQLDPDGQVWQANRRLEARHRLGGLRLGAQLRPTAGLDVAGGARVDLVNIAATDQLASVTGERTMVALSPRLTTSWAGDGLTLFAAYGRGLRPPEARSVVSGGDSENHDTCYYQGGEAHLTTSSSAEVGARIGSQPAMSAGLSLFAIAITNEMVFDHVSGVNIELNRTRRLGGELDLEYRPLPGLELRLDVSAVDARFVASGNPVPNAPRLLARFTAGMHRAGWRAQARLVYLASRELAHGATGAAHAVVDLTGAYRWRNLELGLAVDNALANRWYEGEYHYASWFDLSQPRSQLPRIHYAAGRPFAMRLVVSTWFR